MSTSEFERMWAEGMAEVSLDVRRLSEFMSSALVTRQSLKTDLITPPVPVLAELLAQWDHQESGKGQWGCWFKHLERAVNIAQGTFIVDRMSQFINYAEQVYTQGATTPETALYLSATDRRVYCQRYPQTEQHRPIYYLWLRNQSGAYWYHLAPAYSFAENTFLESSIYSAREIKHTHWSKGKLPKKYFQYQDCRDSGYCGTLEFFSAAPCISYGFTHTYSFKCAADCLFFASKPDEDE